jgi:murein DD-endopeptidase MepM/ murein hydrolase activator NlpD
MIPLRDKSGHSMPRFRFPLLAVAALSPVLMACTETPETFFDWGVNDHLAQGPAAPVVAAPTGPAKAEPKTYAYAEAAPKAAPKPAVETRTLPPPTDIVFAWPVQGKVISTFGTGSDGARNDGINIAAATGTPIHAAAAGTVTYAGDELKAYGNLVLIRHADGYVTAYAHAQRLVVAKGDTVSKGQVIGYAGATGDVDSPQLHFEIRHGTQPVDPNALLVARNS